MLRLEGQASLERNLEVKEQECTVFSSTVLEEWGVLKDAGNNLLV